MRGFLSSGWTIPKGSAEETFTPATKWHMRMNKQGSSLVYHNVYLDGGRGVWLSLMRQWPGAGRHAHVYQISVHVSTGEVRSFVADGADSIVSTSLKQMEARKREGPEVLLTPEDMRQLVRCLRVSWKSSNEPWVGPGHLGNGSGRRGSESPEPTAPIRQQIWT